VVLVRGFDEQLLPPNTKEAMTVLAPCCATSPVVVQAASTLADEGEELRYEVKAAATRALAEAGAVPVRWVIDAASCLVREGSALKSPEVGRWHAGTLVEQLEQLGTRLRVRRIEGEGPVEKWTSLGPDEGWVSFAVSGKPMLRVAE